MVVMTGNNARTSKPKLTPAQRARVKELIEDEGYTRAEALAWVLTLEAGE